jgi:lipopolysaccharide export system protein LptA
MDDGATEIAADKIDISQQSGDAFAHGDVKATWLDQGKSAQGQARPAAGQQSISLGGQGPAHAVAQEAELNRKTNQATFKGHARLWQQNNSIAAPIIVLNGEKKTLAAQSTNRAEPVRVVLVTPEGPASRQAPANGSGSKTSNPSVIRVHGGDLLYSDVARKALMVGGALGPVVAETSSASSVSDQVELYLLPASAHAGNGQGQVDRMIATGHVIVNSQDRRGTGDQLTYTGNTGDYVLTGSAAAPPRIVDPERGTVVGAALIFNSRDDSVSIEGGGHETRTDTTVRQTKGKSEPQK